jgi:superfamily II DNA or RNA helicase
VTDWFGTIREACSRAVWSRGVERVRAEAVSAERVEPQEAVLRVTNTDGLLTPTTTLFLDDGSWDCDCPGLDDPCEHVAAAAIFLNRARKEGREPPTARESGNAGHVRYCFLREGNGLAFERRIVHGESETRIDSSLKAISSEPGAPRLLASDSDLAAERALAAAGVLSGRGKPTSTGFARILPALSGCDDVRLDDQPIRVSAEPLVPHGRLEDDGDGFRLWVGPDPSISETFVGRVALCGDVLRPVRESLLSGRELQDLPRGRRYPAERALELATEILPDLERRIPVAVHTTRLPKTGPAEPPRVRVETRRDGDALVVRADLIYGDPPKARVEQGRLVPLGGTVPVRDEPAEARLARSVQGQLGLPIGREIALRDREALALAGRLTRFEGELRGTAHREFTPVPEVAPRTRLSGTDFDVCFEVPEGEGAGAAGGRRVSGEAVLRAWEAGEALVAVPGGGFAPLPSDWLARFAQPLRSLLEARSPDGTLPTHALPDLARLCKALGEPPPPELGRLRALLEARGDDFEGIPEAVLPADLRATLRGYQRIGVDWLCFLREAKLGALLADDMGLGKTLQVLCALRGRCLVVAPTSVLHNWAEEIAKFRPGLNVGIYHGPDRTLDPASEVTLTTYALLRLDAEALGAISWDAVVLDEAQAIKNPDSQVARAAHALAADWRVTLTGTPVENRLDELWSQLHFCNPGLLGSRARFQERYARPIAEGAAGVAEELRTRIRPFVLRRLKREVAPELPPRTEIVLHCELDSEERRVYDAVRAATRRDVMAKLAAGGNVLAALEALLRLRQAACHRSLVPGQEASGSSKIALLLERLETVVADGHKALVFSQWTGLLDRVEPHLRAGGIAFTRLDGSTTNRGAVVADFQHEDGPPVLLISLRAGGTGLNLTAADHVFLLDPWWNPAVEDQAADRAHRIGQTKPVLVHRLVAEDTVEERILDLQSHKRSLADAALGGADAATALTRADLLALLE